VYGRCPPDKTTDHGSSRRQRHAQTKRVRLSFPGSTSSTGGCRYTVVDPGVTVSSTAGPFLPANWVEVVKVTPGQRVSAISNDAGTFALSITELTD
jgi:hypothetical protein